MKTFDKTYQQLNPQQRTAVDTIDGPVMVLAGPGTGKTQVLAARIARILQQTDTPAASVLALTFTDSAAANMRNRLVKMIGKSGYNVQINTFHAFCSQIIQAHPEFFPIDRNSQALTDLQRYHLFESIVLNLNLQVLKPLNRQLYYLPDIMKTISDLKREGVAPDKFEQILLDEAQQLSQQDDLAKTKRAKLEKNLAKQQELLLIYQEYQTRLRQQLKYDYDDMIMLVVEAFSTEPELLLEYQENIHYFLVDEYQDTNAAQNQVVDLLASFWGDRANVFVVGDPNQAIYRFQGASVENALGFVKRFPQAQVIQLTSGYRCSNNVYNRSHQLISNNTLQQAFTELGPNFDSFNRPLTNAVTKDSGEPIKIYQAPSQTLEIIFVVEQIQNLIKQGVSPDKIAVLYRHNRDAVGVQEALEKWAITYEIDGGNDILKTEVIRQLLEFLNSIQRIARRGEDGKLFEVLQYEWLELDPLLVMKIARAASQARMTMLELIESGFDVFTKYDQGQPVSPLEFSTITQLIDQFKQWQAADANQVFPVWFEQVIDQSGFLPWILQHQNRIELLHYLQSLFLQVKAFASQPGFKLADFLAGVATMQEHKIQLVAEDLNVTTNAVHLSSVHKAKGQEWEYVFLVHGIDGKWGNTRDRELIPLPEAILTQTDVSKKERNEDDRRLFYVGLTRAKKQVIITYAQTMITESKSKESSPSMFIEELTEQSSSSQLKLVEAPEISQNADQYLAKLLQPAPTRDVNAQEKAYFSSLLENFPLSVTALNTYLRDPEEFLYSVLLRVPQIKPEPMSFGSAVHASLEKMYLPLLKDQPILPLDEVLAVFSDSLKKELVGSENFSRRLEHGRTILTKFYHEAAQPARPPLFIERFFGTGFSKTYLGDIPLKGRVDRIDWIDVSTKKVKVIDYKTGNPKSVNEIEGATKSMSLSEREQSLPESIRGPYKRQLLFYKLLADLDPSFVPEVTVGEFVFLQPSPSGKLVTRTFELKAEDVDDLKQLIHQVMTEIRQLTFLTAK